jgi:hypothetical protein
VTATTSRWRGCRGRLQRRRLGGGGYRGGGSLPATTAVVAEEGGGGGGRRRMQQRQKKDAVAPSDSRARSGGGRMEPWMWGARVWWGFMWGFGEDSYFLGHVPIIPAELYRIN